MTNQLQGILTVGVYGFTPMTFLGALRRAEVDCLVDIRARRGMRGPRYAWANSLRLQALLADAGIAYLHLPEFAPTPAIRLLQRRADRSTATSKRERVLLDSGFAQAYRHEVLGGDVLDHFVRALPPGTACPALLCVEREAAACHRSLLAVRLSADSGLGVEDLSP